MHFETWPKTPRLLRDMVVTEKIDGTNAAIIVEKLPANTQIDPAAPTTRRQELSESIALQKGGYIAAFVEADDERYLVGAQSRNRLITPGKQTDNHGFAGWVFEHADLFVALLGEGRHFGEWWGSGIARGYGLPKGEKRFSLFRSDKYAETLLSWKAALDGELGENAIDVVPVMHRGLFDLQEVENCLQHLDEYGSIASGNGFKPAEGVVVFHTAANQVFKQTLEGDQNPKSLKVEA